MSSSLDELKKVFDHDPCEVKCGEDEIIEDFFEVIDQKNEEKNGKEKIIIPISSDE